MDIGTGIQITFCCVVIELDLFHQVWVQCSDRTYQFEYQAFDACGLLILNEGAHKLQDFWVVKVRLDNETCVLYN